jgi:hypothetical protein
LRRHTVSIGSLARDDLTLFANAAVDGDVAMALHSPSRPGEEAVYILLGKERVTLEFYDVEGLERLRDLADEGARRLRAVIAAELS